MKGKLSNNVATTSVFLLFASCLLFLQPAVSFAQNAVSFGSATNFALGSNPFSVAVGDFNVDGKLDLAVANGDDFSALPVVPGRVSILLGDSTGSFGAATNFAVGAVPTSVAVGDFNGDGKLDLAVANFGSNNVSILLGDGTGSFGTATNVSVGTAARSVALGDFNGDGKLDLAVANSGDTSVSPVIPGSLSILLGNGDGTFVGAPGNPSVADGDIPTSVAIGDFNGDAKLDLAVANSGTNNVSIFLGNGDGTFGAATNLTVGTGPVFVALEDVDDDGKLDLAVVNSGSNNVSILLGDGTGSFGATKNFAVGNAPVSAAIGDFNGDGQVDLAVTNSGNNKVSILRGKGDGTFSAAANFSAGSAPWSVAVGDFKVDGKLDLAVTNLRGNNVSIFLGTDTGSFETATNSDFTVGTIPVSLAAGDFDGDGKLDLAMEEVSLLGGGDGTFGAATNHTVGTSPAGVALGDFNGDGKLDLAVANADSNDVSILLGTGTGSFGAATNYTVGAIPFSVAAADFNGDGKLDLAVVNAGSNDVSVLLGTGTGSFGAATNFAVETHPSSVAAADFNGDGKLDLAVANSGDDSVSPAIPGSLSILLGNGDGTFGAAMNYTVGTKPVSVAADFNGVAADFNGDGKTDLAVVNSGDDSVSPAIPGSLSILLGNGDGTFGAATNYGVGTSPAGVALGDFNWDGKLDLAVANSGSNNVTVFVGKGDGTFVAATNLTVGTGPLFIAVGDFNADGRSDLAVANAVDRNVSILLNTTINPAASHTVTVASANPNTGVSIIVAPKDNSNGGNGIAQFTRTYKEGTAVTLTAPGAAGGNNFVRWSGCNSSAGTTCNAIMMANKTVTATYAAPLPLAGSTLPDMEVGVSYDTALVTEGVGPYTFKATKGTFPAGLSGDPSNGHLTGTPNTPLSKKVSFTVLITDANGLSVTGAFKATGYAKLNISTKSLKAGTHGKAYKGKLTAAGGKKPFNWTETSGNLTAAGLTLDPSTGAITGTPAAAGTINLNLQATDSLGGVAQKSLPLTIK